MENKILRIAGLQSLFLLLVCVMIMVFVHNHEQSTVQANSPVQENNSPNYKYDSYEFTVAIDPGHGGIDSGTLGYDEKIQEKDINLAVAKLVEHKLSKEPSIRTVLSRTDDQYLLPEDRTNWMNKENADICISIHCNSAENHDATGVEVLFQDMQNISINQSKELAEICLDNIVKQTNQVNRGVIEGDSIYIVRNAKIPIALVEIGFISNQRELAYLQQEVNQEKIADGIVNAIKQMKGMTTRNEKNSICHYKSGKNEGI